MEIGNLNQAHTASSNPSYRQPLPQSKLSSEAAGFHRYFIVLNPASGSANLEEVRRHAEEKAAQAGKTVEFHELKKDDDLPTILNQAAASADVLVAAGGDGTLAAVATEAFRLQKAFGVVPCGTANVFAAEHCIPKKVEEAIGLLIDAPKTEAVDILLVDQKVYLCHISIGTYSWITTQTPAAAKKRFGRIAYIWNTIKVMFKEHMWTFHMELDGKKIRRRASTIMVTNAGSLGASGLRWGENISTRDGVVEVCVFRARTFRHYLALFWNFLLRREHHPLKEYFHVRDRGMIQGPKNLPVRADGEHVGDGQFHFKVQRQTLRVLMPDANA